MIVLGDKKSGVINLMEHSNPIPYLYICCWFRLE